MSLPPPRAVRLVASCATVCCLALGGCAQEIGIAPQPATGGGEETQALGSFTRFPDMPLPKAASIDLDRTLIFGGEEDWFGRIALDTDFDSGAIFDFYKRELPNFEWQEITSIRSETSVLTYSRRDRIVSIQIRAATLRGSTVVITVSPRGAPPMPVIKAPVPQPQQKSQ